VQGFQEAFSTKEVRDELRKIKKVLGSVYDYVHRRTGEDDREETPGDMAGFVPAIDGTIFEINERAIWLMSLAFRELERTANRELEEAGEATDLRVDTEKFLNSLGLLYYAADIKIQSLTKKTGRLDDYFFDVFVYDVFSVIKMRLNLSPHSGRTYALIWELVCVARSCLKGRKCDRRGIAVAGLSKTAIAQRVRRALRSEQDAEIEESLSVHPGTP
jgi:hypothetical protein